MNRLFSAYQASASWAGNLLVASPSLEQHPLARCVVLVLEHNDEKAVGVVLNSQENEAMQRWCRALEGIEDKQAVLQKIQRSLQSSSEEDHPAVTVCMAKPLSTLDEAAAELGNSLRVFLGRVEWEAGALEVEMARGAWMSLPAFPQLVFGTHENLWKTSVQCVGEMVVASAPGVRGDEEIRWN